MSSALGICLEHGSKHELLVLSSGCLPLRQGVQGWLISNMSGVDKAEATVKRWMG